MVRSKLKARWLVGCSALVRPSLHQALCLELTVQPITCQNRHTDSHTQRSAVLHRNCDLMLFCWRSKSYHNRYNPKNDKNGRNKHDENRIFRRGRLPGWWQKSKHACGGLTSRAQARGTNQREPRSGTGPAIPRCLQRFVRPTIHVSQFLLRCAAKYAVALE